MNSAGRGGGPAGGGAAARRRLSVRDEVKPLVLIAAIAAGIAVNRLAAGRVTHLSWIPDVAIFAVMFWPGPPPGPQPPAPAGTAQIKELQP